MHAPFRKHRRKKLQDRSKISDRDSETISIQFNHPADLAKIEKMLANNVAGEEGTLRHFLAMIDNAVILFKKKIDEDVPGTSGGGPSPTSRR